MKTQYIITRPPNEHAPNAYYNNIYVKTLASISPHVEISSSPDFITSIIIDIKCSNIVPDGTAWINSKLRDHLNLKIGSIVYVREVRKNTIPIAKTILLEIGFFNGNHYSPTIYNTDDVRRGLMASDNSDVVFSLLQPIIIWMPENPKVKILLKVLDISDSLSKARYDNTTTFQLMSNKEFPLKLEREQKRVFNFKDVDILKLGIGGANKEFEEMVRAILAPRLVSKEWQDRLDIKHEKGIIFYGPPGTGKTLMARNLCKMLNTREPKIVRGPEIMSKFVGEAEKNIRLLFQEAEEDYKANGDNADLHIIVFDEIDSIAAKRKGDGVSADINNKVVAQLLSVIDGVDTLNNVILIGTTNRIDMIDEALLRPGRFGIKICFSLSDLEGREQIFAIHMAKILQWKLVEDDVTIHDLALRTKNYTGAEIEAVVKKALSYVIMNEVDLNNLSTIDNFKTKISHAHFMDALREVRPAYGAGEDLSYGMIYNHCLEFDYILNRLNECVEQLVESKVINSSSILLHGLPGSGKTTLAIKTACESGFPYIKIVNTEKLLDLVNEGAKASYIVDMFKESHKSEMAVIILDNIEDLIQYVKMGSRYSPYIHQAISTIINAKVNGKLLVIGTTSKLDVLEDMGLADKFRHMITLPLFSAEYMTKMLGYEHNREMVARDAMLELEKLNKLSA